MHWIASLVVVLALVSRKMMSWRSVDFSLQVRAIRWFLSPLLSTRNDLPALSYKHQIWSAQTLMQTAEQFPSVFDEPTKDLSLVVPAYNEEARIDVMMEEVSWVDKSDVLSLSYSSVDHDLLGAAQPAESLHL